MQVCSPGTGITDGHSLTSLIHITDPDLMCGVLFVCIHTLRSGLLPVVEEEEPMSEASQRGAKAGGGATGPSVAKDNGASVPPLNIRSRIKKDLVSVSNAGF